MAMRVACPCRPDRLARAPGTSRVSPCLCCWGDLQNRCLVKESRDGDMLGDDTELSCEAHIDLALLSPNQLNLKAESGILVSSRELRVCKCPSPYSIAQSAFQTLKGPASDPCTHSGQWPSPIYLTIQICSAFKLATRKSHNSLHTVSPTSKHMGFEATEVHHARLKVLT